METVLARMHKAEMETDTLRTKLRITEEEVERLRLQVTTLKVALVLKAAIYLSFTLERCVCVCVCAHD
jgi:hypothetical protein